MINVFRTIQIAWGDLRISNINCTNNKCMSSSSISSTISGSLGRCNFSTFRENYQPGHYSLEFTQDQVDHNIIISYCNVIENKCSRYLFRSIYTVNIHHCIFKNNTADCMFSNKNNFEGKNSTVTISDSYIDSNTTWGATVIFTKLIENYDFNNFIHFYTENCFIGEKVRVKLSDGLNVVFRRASNRRR